MDDAEAILEALSRPAAFTQLFDVHVSWLYGFCERACLPTARGLEFKGSFGTPNEDLEALR